MDYVYVDNPRQDILRMIPPDGKVLGSIGCGYGSTEAVLVSQGREVHGVDVAATAVERAATRLTSARLIDPSDRAPFPDASLDGLILADVIEHIPAAWEALASYAKAVKPGGWVVVSVPNMRHFHVVKNFVLRGDWPEEPMGIFDKTHVQMMSHRRLVRWCDAAGLDVERWFDQYEIIYRPRFSKLMRALDLMTLKLLHPFFMYQCQVRCRRRGGGTAAPKVAGAA